MTAACECLAPCAGMCVLRPEKKQSREQTSGSNTVGSKNPSQSFVWLKSILPGPAMMMIHQETTVPGGLIASCKKARMSLLHGD